MNIEQKDFFGIPNPCIGICESDNRGWCKGCFRTRFERQQWKQFNDYEKYLVLKLTIRRKNLKSKHRKTETGTSPQLELFTIN